MSIIDYFPFFNEKELLELRVNLLKDYVDKFIISEANKTHSGNPKKFICKDLIKELKLPVEKIQVIEVDIPEDNIIMVTSKETYTKTYTSLFYNEFDRYKNGSIKQTTNEI